MVTTRPCLHQVRPIGAVLTCLEPIGHAPPHRNIDGATWLQLEDPMPELNGSHRYEPVLVQYLATGGPDPLALARALARADQAEREYQAACDQVTEVLAKSPEAMRLWAQEVV